MTGPGDENLTLDRKINFQDTLIVLDHFGHEAADPTDHLLDRKIVDSGKPWQTAEDMEPPTNEKVTFTDVLNNLKSFGHDCSPAPN
jgi:hypothetical protein